MDQAAAASIRHISVAIRADGFFLTTPPKHLARRSQVVLPAYAAPVEAVLAIEFAFVFKPKDPKEKVPAWCPRRITPCAVRVYHYKNPDTELLQSLLRQRGMEPYVSAADYAVCYKNHTAISAEEFQNEVSFLNLSDRLGFPLHPREVLEIDDGLHPYFFYLDDELRLHCIHFRKEDCGRNTLTGFSAKEVAQWHE